MCHEQSQFEKYQEVETKVQNLQRCHKFITVLISPVYHKSPFSPINPLVRRFIPLLPSFTNPLSLIHIHSWKHQPPPTSMPEITFTSLTHSAKKLVLLALTISRIGSMSYLKKIPGMVLLATSLD